MATKSIITTIEQRVAQLIADHKRMSALCQSLTSQRDALERERRAQQQKIKELEHQLTVLQLCEGFGSSPADQRDQRDQRDLAESKQRAKARVNRLMREVDKCINLLSVSSQEGHTEGHAEGGAQRGVEECTEGCATENL